MLNNDKTLFIFSYKMLERLNENRALFEKLFIIKQEERTKYWLGINSNFMNQFDSDSLELESIITMRSNPVCSNSVFISVSTIKLFFSCYLH